jgi:hypothetical protein
MDFTDFKQDHQVVESCLDLSTHKVSESRLRFKQTDKKAYTELLTSRSESLGRPPLVDEAAIDDCVDRFLGIMEKSLIESCLWLVHGLHNLTLA